MSKTRPTQAPTTPAETELPEGWALVHAQDVCEINPRKPVADALPADAPVTFVPMAAVDENLGAITAPEDRPFGEIRPKSYTPFAEGDVLFAKITPCMENGKAAVARGLTNKLGFGTTEFHVFRPDGALMADYLYHYIRQQSFRDDAQAHMAGAVGQLRVPADYVKDFELPLPPLPEQKRIVAKVEALLERVNAAGARLAKVPAILKRFRQSVLAAACSGQLTAEWRDSSDCEPVELALKRSGRDVDPKAIKHLVRRGSSGLPEPEEFETPHNWVLRTVRQLVEAGAILDFQDGNHGSLYPRASDFGDTGVKFLTAAQVFDNRVLLDETPLLKTDKAKSLRIGFAKPRDVLLTHNATVGRVAILPEYQGDVILGTSVTYYRTRPQVLLPEFLCFAMQAQLWQRQLRSVMEQTTRNQVSVTKQVEFLLLVPPIEEQKEIARRVTTLFALADSIEAHVRAATVRAERLPQAILARAFRGELVPTEAELARAEGREYEPASVLLERIQEAQARHQPAKRGRGAARVPASAGRVARKQYRR